MVEHPGRSGKCDVGGPFEYSELVPYYEWVEATLPVQTAAMGTKEETFFRGAQGIGLPVNATKNVSRDSFRPQENAILQPSGTAGHVTETAAGCTENPRLWLNSGLPNPNDWVGRGYTDHFFDWVFGVFDTPTGSSKGVGSSARCDFPGQGGLENVGLPPGLQAFSMNFSDSGIRGAYTNGRGPTGPWDGPAGRILGPDLKRILSHVDQLLNVLVITDDDVEAQNRVTLSAINADEHGPVAKVEFHARQRSARTLRNREHMAAKAAELVRAAGAREVFRLDWPPLILHVQSTMRMGQDQATSVLDENAEARWVRRLFVADNSALANALGGPNPTLTSQALATRTAERIFQHYFGGQPWVGTEAPVASTDPRVTAALA